MANFAKLVDGDVPKWLREEPAKLRFSGSSPLVASKFL